MLVIARCVHFAESAAWRFQIYYLKCARKKQQLGSHIPSARVSLKVMYFHLPPQRWDGEGRVFSKPSEKTRTSTYSAATTVSESTCLNVKAYEPQFLMKLHVHLKVRAIWTSVQPNLVLRKLPRSSHLCYLVLTSILHNFGSRQHCKHALAQAESLPCFQVLFCIKNLRIHKRITSTKCVNEFERYVSSILDRKTVRLIKLMNGVQWNLSQKVIILKFNECKFQK